MTTAPTETLLDLRIERSAKLGEWQEFQAGGHHKWAKEAKAELAAIEAKIQTVLDANPEINTSEQAARDEREKQNAAAAGR